MPPSRLGTILRFNIPCAMPQHMGLQKCSRGRSIRRVKISVSFTTRPTDQCQCSSMEAARTSWASGIPEQTRGLCISRNIPSYRQKKFGLGELTRMVLIGARRSPITIAPTSNCKRASFEIKKRMHSLNPVKSLLSRNIGCLSGIPVGFRARILPGWSTWSERPVFWRSPSMPTERCRMLGSRSWMETLPCSMRRETLYRSECGRKRFRFQAGRGSIRLNLRIARMRCF